MGKLRFDCSSDNNITGLTGTSENTDEEWMLFFTTFWHLTSWRNWLLKESLSDLLIMKTTASCSLEAILSFPHLHVCIQFTICPSLQGSAQTPYGTVQPKIWVHTVSALTAGHGGITDNWILDYKIMSDSLLWKLPSGTLQKILNASRFQP